jgi:hypothetical protein
MFNKLLEENPLTLRETKNERGQTIFVEFLDKEGNLVERETYDYDEHGLVSRRNTFDGDHALVDYEVFVRDSKARLAQHERRDATGRPIYIEKWTRNGEGKTLYAEAWHYNEAGEVADYKRLIPNSEGHLVDPRRQWAIVVVRGVSMLIGVLCMFTAINAYTAGNTALTMLAAAAMLLNFWSAVKKR